MSRTRNKYHAKKHAYNGMIFDSGIELERYQDLELLQAAGEITDLQRAPTYTLIKTFKRGGVTYRAVKYTPDFTFRRAGQVIVEEVKSKGTKQARDYMLRVKLFLSVFPDVVFEEVLY
jgi:hypothetical protein